MYSSPSDPQHQPLFYLRGHPVGLAMLLVAIHTLALIAAAAAGPGALEFAALRGTRLPGLFTDWPSWWQWGTYLLCHAPGLWFLLDMWFLWRWGSELERLFGRRVFGLLYAALTAIPALTAALALGTGMAGSVFFAGTRYAHFSLFLGIVFLQPQAPVFGGLRLWHLGAAFFAVYLLEELSMRSGTGTAALCLSALATYGILRRAGLSPRFSGITEAIRAARPRKPQKTRPLPYQPKIVPRPEVTPERPAVTKIDAILDKIARNGLDSLETWEREELKRASRELNRQDG